MKQNQIILAILLFVFLLDIQSIFGDNSPSRPSVGVVLSGGGARGIAHIGVLRVLEKYQIPIDYIGGTSFGALIAAFYASGYDSYQIEKIIKNIN
ncbi:MAG: patatin-like phospholipase family protein, partial [Candidatus Cloacimonetes bacterium]|nr:patatin-like phospholipase family protein [Candidatus Cloacimonadota bacterium]